MTPLPFDDDRFWDKVTFTDSCWLWNAANNGKYGVYRNGYAHRYSWEQANGKQIPGGMEIDHLCYQPSCVNPAHLECVTPQENMRRAGARVTHCPAGHEYNDENTRIMTYGNGRRMCKACDRIYQLKKARAKGARPQGTYSLKLTEDQVRQIRSLLQEGLSQSKIAERVGCSQTYVSQIKLGKLKWANEVQ